LAVAVNVFAARYEPERSGLYPTGIRPFSLFEPTFLPACPDCGPGESQKFMIKHRQTIQKLAKDFDLKVVVLCIETSKNDNK
jgi:hypothetical protein